MPPPVGLFSPAVFTISSEHTISPLSPLHEHSTPLHSLPERARQPSQLRLSACRSACLFLCLPVCLSASDMLPAITYNPYNYLFYFLFVY